MLILYGGDGFLGHHVSVAAHRRGLPFLVVSRRGDPEFLRTHAPTGLAMSVDEFAAAPGDRALTRAEAFVHFAWSTVPGSPLADPTQELDLNVRPAWRLFDRIGRARPGLPIVFFSSGGTVYGDTGDEPADETRPPAPVCAYGAAKLMAEAALRQVCARHGARARVLRPSNPVGRWHRRPDQGLVGVAARRLLAGEVVTLFGDGGAVRDFLSADDLAEAVLAVAEAKDVEGVWNVSSGEARSILSVVEQTARTLGVEPRIRFEAARGCDVARAALDSSALRRDFGWSPRRTLEEAIADAVAGIRMQAVELA